LKVFLDGQTYELAEGTGVKRSPLVEWADNIRLDGQQLRKDRRFMSSWAIDSWISGLGREQTNLATASDLTSLWDAENVDTRFDSIVLSPAFNTCTIVPSRGDLDIALEHQSQLYFLETLRADFTGLGNAYQFTVPFTIGSISRVCSNINGGSISAAKSFGNYIAVVAGSSLGCFLGRIATLGGVATYSGFVEDKANRLIRLSQIGDMGGTLHELEYLTVGGIEQARFLIADRDLLNRTVVGTLLSVVGTYLPPLVTDGLTMYAQLPQGIFDFDTTPAITIDTSRAQDKNGAQVMFQNNLYFKNKKSLIKWDGTNLEAIGYDLRDGLKGEKMGEITALTSSWDRVFAAVKGGTYSHILTMDSNHKWQYYARIPTAGLWVRELLLCDAPDAIDRLWVLFGNYGYPGYFLNPMVNPLQAATYSYVPTGNFTPPINGGDLPEESGAFFDYKFNLNGMGGSNILTALYGLNGDSPVTTLGVVATNTALLTFGSPYGVEGYKIQPDIILAGANSGTTPIYRSSVIHYLKDPPKREMFDFTIDVEKTANPMWSKEQILGSLTYVLSNRVLMPFWYGAVGTKHIKTLDMPSDEETKEQVFEGERDSQIRVRLIEVK